MNDQRHDDQRHDDQRQVGTDRPEREAELERSGLNPNVADPTAAAGDAADDAPAGPGRPRRGGPGQAAPPDPDAPARSVDDTTSPEAVEPNEPG